MTEEAPQRSHHLRDVFNGLRWMARAGAPWRLLPNDLPPWEAVYQQTQRWLRASVFEAMGHAWRVVLRLAEGRTGQLRPRSWTATRGRPRRRAAPGLAMTGPNGREGARGIERSTPSAIGWPCLSPPPM